MQDMVGECLSFTTDIFLELIDWELGILWMLANVDTSSLQGMPAHLGVEGKVLKPRVSSKSTIFVHH